jgi:Ca2+-binding RTX toxin-like protein
VNADLGAFDGTDDGAADAVVVDGTAGADDVSVASVPGRTTDKGLATVVNVTHGAPTDTFAIEGLGGDDHFTSDTTSAAQLGVLFDGGEGADATVARGTAGDDSIGIARGADAVAVFGPGGNAVLTKTESLEVDGLAGNDTVSGQNGIAGLTALTVDGGAGNDRIGGGDGADVLIGGAGDDVIDGNRGNDSAFLGGGDDTFVWDPGDGSDTVEGQAGHDTLQFNGSNAAEKIELDANGPRLRLTRDVGVITMDTDGVESVNVRTLGSADTVTVNDLRGTDVNAVNVDLGGFDGTADATADAVVVNGTPGRDVLRVAGSGGSATVSGLAATVGITNADPSLDSLTINGNGGNDVVDASGLAPGGIALTVN